MSRNANQGLAGTAAATAAAVYLVHLLTKPTAILPEVNLTGSLPDSPVASVRPSPSGSPTAPINVDCQDLTPTIAEYFRIARMPKPNYQFGITLAKAATERCPTNPQAVALLGYAKHRATKPFNEVTECTTAKNLPGGELDPMASLCQGIEAARHSKYEDALSLSQTAIDLANGNPLGGALAQAHGLACAVQYLLDNKLRYPEAEKDCITATELDPNDSQLWGFMAQLYVRWGETKLRTEEAKKAATKALELRPDSVYGAVSLALQYAYEASDLTILPEVEPPTKEQQESDQGTPPAEEYSFTESLNEAERRVHLGLAAIAPEKFSGTDALVVALPRAVLTYYLGAITQARETLEPDPGREATASSEKLFREACDILHSGEAISIWGSTYIAKTGGALQEPLSTYCSTPVLPDRSKPLRRRSRR